MARVCDECTWHHKTFLTQLYQHLAIKLYCIVVLKVAKEKQILKEEGETEEGKGKKNRNKERKLFEDDTVDSEGNTRFNCEDVRGAAQGVLTTSRLHWPQSETRLLGRRGSLCMALVSSRNISVFAPTQQAGRPLLKHTRAFLFFIGLRLVFSGLWGFVVVLFVFD